MAAVFLIVFALLPDHQRQKLPVLCCQIHLSSLGTAVQIYVHDHNDTFPPSFDSMTNYPVSDKPFNCPTSGEKYVLVRGVTTSTPVDSIVAYCPTKHRMLDPNSEGLLDKLGINVLFRDGHVETIEASEAINRQLSIINNQSLRPSRLLILWRLKVLRMASTVFVVSGSASSLSPLSIILRISNLLSWTSSGILAICSRAFCTPLTRASTTRTLVTPTMRIRLGSFATSQPRTWGAKNNNTGGSTFHAV